MSGPDREGMLRMARSALLNEAAAMILADTSTAICDPTRVQIVRALGAVPLTVGELTRVIGRQRTVTSQHLRVLREAGLVEFRREGRVVYYRLSGSHGIRVAQTALDAAVRASR